MSLSFIFYLLFSLLILVFVFVPGVMGIVTSHTSISYKGRTFIYTGQKAVVIGIGMVSFSVCMLILFYLVYTGTSTGTFSTILIIGAGASILIPGGISMFVGGTEKV